jgi:hypothetical protein
MANLIEPDTEAWALANLPYFRCLGFFADLMDRSDPDVLAEIARRYVEAEELPYTKKGKLPPPWEIEVERPFADLRLLQYDYHRVWWEDTECVYPPEVLAYQDAVIRWGEISRGAFRPVDVRESWGGTDESPEAPTVFILTETGTLTLTPVACNDWFDLTALVPINRYLDPGPGDIRLELYEPFDQTAFVVALTPHEREELRQTRGWSFHQWS